MSYSFNTSNMRRISATFMANATAPRPVNGGLPSYSSGIEPIQCVVISSSKPMSCRSMFDRNSCLFNFAKHFCILVAKEIKIFDRAWMH